ncbi:hypothetical protein MVEN_01865600 [Mycena venus]|uniref:CCHC-type domain-containing protein n=1 Tax=Mycena venus TaxID=2733690 RepID=A0A8H6XGX7_9AGAR|nr:hypothetical protein MVEN_01865600 [Mycena venus]
MLSSLLRVRPATPSAAFAIRRLALPALRGVSLRSYSDAAPATGEKRTSSTPPAKRFMKFCLNCRREGHLRNQCTEPVICVACGVEGHQRRDCPAPDPARIEALKTAPVKCFRCGVEGHKIGACPQPPKCFHCGVEGHIQKDCPTNPRRAKAQAKAAPSPSPEAEVSAAAVEATVAA